MVVALGAFEGQAEEGFSEGIGAIGNIFNPIFLIDDTPFLGNFVVSVKPGGEQCFSVIGL